MTGSHRFDYTIKQFWGGPWYPYWSLLAVTVLGGFFGLDHFWLRSPTTGILKFIVNIFGFGIWWMYDLIQIFGEKDVVMEHGLTAPIVGPLGIGAGMFRDNQPDAPLSKSPFRWMGFLATMFMPFGLDSLIAGDTDGALARFATFVMILFLWPIALAWGVWNVGRTLFTPKKLFEEGTFRMFPFTWFMDPNGPSKLGPHDVPIGSDAKCDQGSDGFFKRTFGAILVFLDYVLPTIVKTALNSAFPGLMPAVEASAAAVTAVAGTTKAAANTATVTIGAAKNIVEAAREPAKAVVSTASQAVHQIPAALDAAQSLAGPVAGQLQSFTTPEGLLKAAGAGAGATMAGGGVLLDSNSDMTNSVLFGFFILILGGGAYMAARRLNIVSRIFPTKEKEDGSQRNDAPPKPSSI